MGTGLSQEQKVILRAILDLGNQHQVASISRICERLGIGYARVGYCTRRWISPVTRRKSIWRSLRRLQKRGLIQSLGRGLWNEERWVATNKMGVDIGKKIAVVRPGVVDRLRVARTPKYCSLCGRPINPGESYWNRKRSWRRYSVPVCERCG